MIWHIANNCKCVQIKRISRDKAGLSRVILLKLQPSSNGCLLCNFMNAQKYQGFNDPNPNNYLVTWNKPELQSVFDTCIGLKLGN